MVSKELMTIIGELNTQGEMRFVEAATEKQIADFEEKNNVKLPDQYKAWLQFSDGGECFLPGGVQYYGVEHKPVINTNDNDRPNEDFVVIGTLASGDPIVFRKGKQDISIYNHENGRIEDDETYENFYAFLKNLYDMLGIGG